MDQRYFIALQERVENYFRQITDVSLDVASQDCCSEMARLVGTWIVRDFPLTQIEVYKARSLSIGQNDAHELLVLESDGELYVIDPTIWQLFPDVETMVFGPFSRLQQALEMLNSRYGGEWQKAEKIDAKILSELPQLEQTLKELILETRAH